MSMFAIDIQRVLDMTTITDNDWQGDHIDTVTMLLPVGTKLRTAVDLLQMIFDASMLAHSSAVDCWGNANARLAYVRLRMTERSAESGEVISRLTPDGTGDW